MNEESFAGIWLTVLGWHFPYGYIDSIDYFDLRLLGFPLDATFISLFFSAAVKTKLSKIGLFIIVNKLKTVIGSFWRTWNRYFVLYRTYPSFIKREFHQNVMNPTQVKSKKLDGRVGASFMSSCFNVFNLDWKFRWNDFFGATAWTVETHGSLNRGRGGTCLSFPKVRDLLVMVVTLTAVNNYQRKVQLSLFLPE